MAEKLLTAKKVAELKEAGWKADGNGLYCRVRVKKTKGGEPMISKSWVYVVQKGGKRVEYQIGPVSGVQGVSLAIAREKAQEIRDDRARGKDVTHKSVTLYRDVIDGFIEREAGNKPTYSDFVLSLKTRAASLMPMELAKITDDDIFNAIKPVLDATPSIGNRMLGRLNALFDEAVALKQVAVNPINMKAMRIRLDYKSLKPAEHRKAAPYSALPEAIKALRKTTNVATQAVELLTLTACRLEEIREMRWSEIDEDEALFVLPAARSKTKKDYVKPLTPRAMEIIKARRAVATSDLVFESEAKANVAVSAVYMRKVFKEALQEEHKDSMLHGLRSCFSDYCHDKTDNAPETIESALGHAVGNAVARAYRRGQAVDKMRKCFDDWSAYLD